MCAIAELTDTRGVCVLNSILRFTELNKIIETAIACALSLSVSLSLSPLAVALIDLE